MAGTLRSIFISEKRGEEPREVESVEAVAGKGLAGDRYFGAPDKKGVRRHVTLIEAEALAALPRDYQLEIRAAESGRNLLTEGVALNHFVGRELKVGGAVLLGVELCEPCGYLEKRTVPGLKAALRHRGGLRAAVIEGGTLAVGDAIGPVSG